ncbi:Serine phosphatase RsbU, regulator of sigma subunit [Streptomyces sp. WMMB 714]|uniref:PP2C family protein-serine/threonine phosphatase n=1 Tax=Streptomyces sp. WMMB 714 TaxID=1286822 RepID=UPI0008238FA7|nr:PP2C family protein-serine/threonine phosphatase [Streptomyces sp. WMMB 714]SCK50123.1 Serine phosphatase RsbU, regulator of sigma subunit [Streptomyces sp. WMMB 714]
MERHFSARQPQPGRERQADTWGGRVKREGRFTGAPSVRRVVSPLPVVMILVAIGLDLATAPTLTGSALFCAAPLVAAPFFTTIGTALIGMLSVGGVALMRVLDEMSTGLMDLSETASTGVVALLAIVINRLLRRSGAAVSSARTIAEAAQFAVLPVPPTRIGRHRIAARYRAAQVDARIGGDLYAVQETPYGVRLVVGDVRGAGMDAVATMAVVIGAFREAAEQEATLTAVAARLERALHREAGRQRGDAYDEGFTTALLAEIPAGRTGALRIVNRGHPSPLLLAGGDVRFIDPSRPALPLGMYELGAAASDRVDEAAFPPDSTLLLYTDGLSEARNAGGEFFEPDKALAGRAFDDPETLLDAVLADVQAHTGGASSDDMALMAIAAEPEDTGQGDRGG